jgi:hypothetical protein
VKGEATDASATDNETPACAVLKAPQSLAPNSKRIFRNIQNK